jgi:MFS family permease
MNTPVLRPQEHEQRERSPMSIPTFRAVWLGGMISNLGAHIQAVGASWLMVSIGGSATLVALVQSSTALPFVLLSLWAGAMADNLDRRRLMLAAQGFMLVVSTLLAIVTWMGVITPWLLLALTFLIGCGTALNAPASQTSVADIVPRSSLASAVSLKAMSFNVARCIGPGIGGAITTILGVAAAFAANALSYVGLILVLARWRMKPPEPKTTPESVWGAMAAGLRYVAMSPKIRVVLLRGAVFGVAASATPALMPLVSRDLLAGAAMAYGALLGAFGFGAVITASLSAALRRLFSSETLTRLAACALAIGAAGAALSPWLALSMAALALAGSGWMLALATFNVTVQLASPRWVAARALALYQTALLGGMAGGSFLFGTIGEHWGVQAALLWAAGAQLLGIVLGLRFPLPRVDHLNLEQREGWVAPDLDVRPRSGPIMIAIEYRIAHEDTASFLGAMNERRRIHRRDGARDWTLARDLADRSRWVESYRFPTWQDYIRHNHRRTLDDSQSWDQVRGLHIGSEPPFVRRWLERQAAPPPSPGDATNGAVTFGGADPTHSA